jgi:hypothetical protein
MTKPRAAKPTVQFIDSYSELYKDLFPEVRAYEYFKYLLLGLISDVKTHIPYLATRILINTNKSRLAEVLPHKGFRNHNLLINKSTPLYAAQKH